MHEVRCVADRPPQMNQDIRVVPDRRDEPHDDNGLRDSVVVLAAWSGTQDTRCPAGSGHDSRLVEPEGWSFPRQNEPPLSREGAAG
jgi:hypothetical protein